MVFSGGTQRNALSVLESLDGSDIILAPMLAKEINGIDPVIVPGARIEDRTVKKSTFLIRESAS